MKAGAFGRQRERRPVQPGGRVLPGMFAGAGTASAPASTTTSSSPPSVRAETRSTPPAKADAVLSRFGTGGGQGSGRFSSSSRLDRPVESVVEPVEAAATRKPVSDSISRARRLGLNRAARTPSPEPDPPQSPVGSDDEDDDDEEPAEPVFSRSSPRRQEAEAAAPRPAATRAAPAHPPESNNALEPRAPPSDEAEETPNRAPARPLPGLLSSLWNRASELVGGTAPATAQGDEAGESQAVKKESEEDAQARKEGADGEQQEEGEEPPSTARTKKAARPIVVPALVAPALAGNRPPSATRAVSAPNLPADPPPEPITYHRPPLLHQRSVSPEVQRFRSQPSPYDWLDSRDESPLVPYMFLPTAAQAAAMEARMRSKAAAAQAAATSPPWPAAVPYAHPYPPSLPPHHLSSSTTFPPAGFTPSHHAAVSSGGGVAIIGPESQTSFVPQQTSADGRADRHLDGVTVNAPERAISSVPPLVQPASLPVAPPALRPQPMTSVAVAPTSAPAVALSTTAPLAPAPAAFQTSTAGSSLFAPPILPQTLPPASTVPALPELLPRYSESALPAHVAPCVDQRAAATSPASPPLDRASTGSGTAPGPARVALPRAGSGGDSLPIHPSPAELAPATTASAPLAPFVQATSGAPSTSFPPQLARPTALAPALPTTATARPASQLPSASTVPPLVAPAALSYVLAPQSSSFPPPTIAPMAGAATSGVPDFGPLDVLKAVVRKAVLADDAPQAKGHSTSLAQGYSPLQVGPKEPPSTEVDQGDSDLPAMPKLRHIPVTPPPESTHPPPLSRISPATSSSAVSVTNEADTSRSASPLSSRSEAVSSHAGTLHEASTAPSSGAHTTIPTPPSVNTLDNASLIGQVQVGDFEPSSQPASAVAQTPNAQIPQLEEERTLVARSCPPSATSASAASSIVAQAQTPPPLLTATSAAPDAATPAPLSRPVQSTLALPPPVPARPASIPPLPPQDRPNSRLARIDSADEPAATASPADSDHCGLLHAELKAENACTATAPIQPKLELQTLDLDFGDFGSSFSLTTPTVVGPAEIPEVQEVAAVVTARPMTEARQRLSTRAQDDATRAGLQDAVDPLDRAFDETASFVADFAHATLERARIDPNHTERTERWLEQTGVRAQPMSGLSVANAATDRSMPSSYRPMTAPPASVAPDLLQVTSTIVPAVPVAYGSFDPGAAAAGLPSSSSSAPGLYIHTVCVPPSFPREPPEPSSPLETAIGARSAEETALARGRSVAPNFEARARDRLAALPPENPQISPATSPQQAARNKIGAAQDPPISVKGEAEKARSPPQSDFEPLVGDKGETASEVAAMFSNW